MIDLGTKQPDYSGEVAAPSKSKKTVMVYPSLSFTTDKEMEFPGGDFMASVRLKPKGYEEREDEKGKKTCTYRFDVVGMEPGDEVEEEKEEEVEDAASAIMASMKKARNKKIESEDDE